MREMKTRAQKLIFLVILLTSCCSLCAPVQDDGSSSDFSRILEALDRAISFFERKYDEINLDGMFGLRLAEGQLMTARNYSLRCNISPVLLLNLEHMRRRANATLQHSLPYLLTEDAKYFQVFHLFVDNPFVSPDHKRRSQLVAVDDSAKSRQYIEKQGDACIGHLIESSADGRPLCQMKDQCRQMMMSSGKTGYAITHQLLFFITMQHVGCADLLKGLFNVTGLSDFEQERCDRIFTEANTAWLEDLHHAADWKQDLFLEQSVICGMLGFEDFFKPTWLNLVLSLQSENGCFDRRYAKHDHSEFADHVESRVLHTRRHLLVETQLEDACLSHKSGLGTALLSLYLRYLLENGGQFPLDAY